jgi:hypothetical protein
MYIRIHKILSIVLICINVCKKYFLVQLLSYYLLRNVLFYSLISQSSTFWIFRCVPLSEPLAHVRLIDWMKSGQFVRILTSIKKTHAIILLWQYKRFWCTRFGGSQLILENWQRSIHDQNMLIIFVTFFL